MAELDKKQVLRTVFACAKNMMKYYVTGISYLCVQISTNEFLVYARYNIKVGMSLVESIKFRIV